MIYAELKFLGFGDYEDRKYCVFPEFYGKDSDKIQMHKLALEEKDKIYKDHVPITLSWYDFMARNGFIPADKLREFFYKP